jgi:hypothetical protein
MMTTPPKEAAAYPVAPSIILSLGNPGGPTSPVSLPTPSRVLAAPGVVSAAGPHQPASAEPATQAAVTAGRGPATAGPAAPARSFLAAPPTYFMDASAATPASRDAASPPPPADGRSAGTGPADPLAVVPAPAPPTGAAGPPATSPAPPPAAPAQPAAPAVDDAARFKVTSLVATGKRATAIINGHVVGVGDTISGAKVLAITPHSVELDVGGRRVTLRM